MYTLQYFPIKGKAEAIRLAFDYASIEFNDEKVTKAEFAEFKHTLPFAMLPVLKSEDGKMIGETTVILKHVGKMAGLYPKDDEEATTLIDQIISYNDHAITLVYSTLYIDNEELKIARRKKITDEILKLQFGQLDKFIAKSGKNGYCVGESITIADIQLFSMVDYFLNGTLENFSTEFVTSNQNIMKVYETVKAEPKLQKRISTYNQ